MADKIKKIDVSKIVDVQGLMDLDGIPKTPVEEPKKKKPPKKKETKIKGDEFKKGKAYTTKNTKKSEPVTAKPVVTKERSGSDKLKKAEIKIVEPEKPKKPKKKKKQLTESEQEYRKVRRNLQAQINRAKKLNRPTVEMPEMLKKGASDLEADIAIQKLEELKEIQKGYTSEYPTITIVDDDERDDYYTIYVETFLSRVYELDYVWNKDNIHGRLVIDDFIDSCVDKAGYKATATMIKAASDNGLVITWEKKYTDVAKEFIDEMVNFLGIDLPLEEREAIDEYRDSLTAAFDYENDYIW